MSLRSARLAGRSVVKDLSGSGRRRPGWFTRPTQSPCRQRSATFRTLAALMFWRGFWTNWSRPTTWQTL